MKVISTDQQGSTVTVAAFSPESAASVALTLAGASRFITVTDGAWTLTYPARVEVSAERLAHIITHHANVTLQ